MISKNLRKSIDKMIKISFETSGTLVEKKALECAEALKSLSGSTAILSLSYFLKGLRREMNKTTLEIFSATPLSSLQVKKVVSNLKGKYTISQIHANTNKDLLGGIRIKIGDIVFDDSVSQKIYQLKGAING